MDVGDGDKSSVIAFDSKARARCSLEPPDLLLSFQRATLDELCGALLERKQRGMLLCYEMGLGKTVLTLALVLEMLRRSPTIDNAGDATNAGWFLIVCPKAVLAQWSEEFLRRSNLPAHLVHRYAPTRGHPMPPEALERHTTGIVLASYPTLVRSFHVNGDKGPFGVRWRLLVLDESHTIRTSGTLVHRAVSYLAEYSPHSQRLCLTGTPFVNRWEDLVPQAAFVGVEPYDQRASWNVNHGRREWIREWARRTVIRVVRADVPFEQLPLPPLARHDVRLDFSANEWRCYGAMWSIAKAGLDQVRANTHVLTRPLDPNAKTRMQVLAGAVRLRDVLDRIQRLRRCCNHPCMGLTDPGRQALADRGVLTTRHTPSTKIRWTVDLIERETALDSRCKFIVFSQWIDTLDLVQAELQRRRDAAETVGESARMRYARLDGRMTEEQRIHAVRLFVGEPSCRVMLLTLGAGAHGLNLMVANRVVILDQWWNEAVENQVSIAVGCNFDTSSRCRRSFVRSASARPSAFTATLCT